MWANMSDDDRLTILFDKSNGWPDHTIRIDNDSVYVTFEDEDPEEMDYDVTILNFEEFGYSLLQKVFTQIGLKAEFV
jgi:hypothetical protein